MTKFFLIAATMLSVTAVPAFANDDRPAAAAASGAATATGQTDALRTPPRQQRYCVVETITGSLIAQKTCHTRDEWLGLGFDPLAKRQ